MIYGYKFTGKRNYGVQLKREDLQDVIDYTRFVGIADGFNDAQAYAPVALSFAGYGLDSYIVYGQLCSECGNPFVPDSRTDQYCVKCNDDLKAI